jgi:hypothetical protein
VVKVYVFPADYGGCGFYRLIWPTEQLQRDGHDIVIVHPKERDKLLQARLNGDTIVSVRIPSDADVMVFQRVTHKYLVQAIRIIKQQDVAVVIDMDDDLTCIHPANPAFHMLHPTGPNSAHSWQNTQEACDAATLVTVSTPALLTRYARRAPGHVLYNAVPQRYLTVPHEDSDVVGWAGSVHSHPTDLQVMGPTVAQLLQKGHTFKIVGPVDGVHAALGVPHEREIRSVGVVGIREWPLAVATIGIGVAPLADSRFNASKSWLKPLEYSAVGVPWIASPRAEYERLHKLSVGVLAKDPREWRARLRELLKDRWRREDMSMRGREVAAQHTIEGNAWRWLEAWQLASDIAVARSSKTNASVA